MIDPYGGTSWYMACLLPPSAASLLAACLVNWERVAAGINWDTWSLPVAQQSSFCVQSVFLMLALDVLLFGVLTWYCDKVRGWRARADASLLIPAVLQGPGLAGADMFP